MSSIAYAPPWKCVEVVDESSHLRKFLCSGDFIPGEETMVFIDIMASV